MNCCPTNLLQHLFLFAVLFLFVGLAATAQQPGSDPPKDEIATAGRDGVTMPRCLHCPDPTYSKEARSQNYNGKVVLLVVVTREGKAGDIQVLKSPGLGLDEKAIETVRKWKFKPAMKDGRPVACRVPVEFTFRSFGPQ